MSPKRRANHPATPPSKRRKSRLSEDDISDDSYARMEREIFDSPSETPAEDGDATSRHHVAGRGAGTSTGSRASADIPKPSMPTPRPETASMDSGISTGRGASADIPQATTPSTPAKAPWNPRPVTSTTTPRPFLSRGGPPPPTGAPPLSIPGTVGFGVGHPPIADVGQRLQTWHLEFNEGPTISVAGQPTRSWFFHLRQGFVHNVDGALTAHHDVVLEPVRVVRGTSLPMSTTSMPSQITSERTPPRAED
ncbi:unnamed protein product [Symbiodinium natans]|uniref:Uncharacterized protein n=1 Tax=Symbiodinium natans TaxID=878477 RepID=A0A812LRJ0_9DINO|nr:unnamed protein product [Symbiodinium natans]